MKKTNKKNQDFYTCLKCKKVFTWADLSKINPDFKVDDFGNVNMLCPSPKCTTGALVKKK